MNTLLEDSLTEASFAFLKLSIFIDALDIPIISTGRPFAFYRNVLFGGLSEAEVLAEVRGKTIVDVGCGLTPYLADSMFQACRAAGVEFYGVDPKIGQGFTFGAFDRLKSLATGARHTPDPAAPGLERAKAAFAHELPFADASVDVILSNFLLGAWIRDEKILAPIFGEFHRILKPGGRVRLYPQEKWRPGKLRTPALREVLGRFDVRQEFRLGRLDFWTFPSAFMTELTKR
jgi:SAM-dependent methyltransferase